MKYQTDRFAIGNRAAAAALFLLFLLGSISCSTSTRQLFFDIDPPTAEELAEKERQEQLRQEPGSGEDQKRDVKALAFDGGGDDGPRPAVESAQTWEEVLESLPQDYKDGVDWVAAIEQGLVRPRTGTDANAKNAAAFKYDFIIEELPDKPKNEGYFPHSAHTAWLGCKNCHATLYKYKRNPATMKDMRAGASCGACHGTVAFSLTLCKRCHLDR